MAEAVLSALVQVIFENLSCQIFEEYGMLHNLHGTKKEMRKLQSVLSTIQAVLDSLRMQKIGKYWIRQ